MCVCIYTFMERGLHIYTYMYGEHKIHMGVCLGAQGYRCAATESAATYARTQQREATR